MKAFGAVALFVLLAVFPVLFGVVYDFGDLAPYFSGIVRVFRDSFWSGNWLWHHEIASGYLVLANPQYNPFYLPDWVSLLPLHPMQTLTLNISLHVLIGLVGAFIWFRFRGASTFLAFLVALIFGFQGAAASLSTMLDNLQVLVWLPWLLWSWSRLEWRPARMGWFWGISFLVIGAGEPQALMILGILATPWLLGDASRRWVGLLLLASALCCQPWVIPFLEGVAVSERVHGVRSMFDRPWVLDWSLLATFVSPSSMQSLNGMGWNGERTNWLQSMFVGAVFVWSWLHFSWRRHPKVIGLIGIQLVFSYIATRELPGANFILDHVFPFSLVRFPSRYVAFFPSILIFLGFEVMNSWVRSPRALGLRTVIYPWMAVLGLFCVSVLGHRLMVDPNASFSDWLGVLGSDALLFVGVSGIVLFGLMRGRKSIVLVGMILDVLWVFVGFSRLSPWSSELRLMPAEVARQLSLDLPGRWVDLMDFARSERAYMRDPAGPPLPAPADTGIWLRIPPQFQTRPISIEPFASKWDAFLVMRPRAATGVIGEFATSVDSVRENIAWHAGVNYSVSMYRDGKWVAPFRDYPGKPVAQFHFRDHGILVRKHESMPTAFLFTKVDTSEDFWATFREDPRKHPRAMLYKGDCKISSGVPGTIHWTKYSDHRYVVRSSGGSGVLALNQEYYPGWKSVVDGVEREAIRVNGIQMGACIDTTARLVEFVYRPWWLRWIPIQLGLGCLVLMAPLGWSIRSRFRELRSGVSSSSGDS